MLVRRATLVALLTNILFHSQGVRWVAAGGSHTVAVTESAVHSWGDNGSGQLGLGHFKEQHQPMEILSLKSQNVSLVEDNFGCYLQHWVQSSWS